MLKGLGLEGPLQALALRVEALALQCLKTFALTTSLTATRQWILSVARDGRRSRAISYIGYWAVQMLITRDDPAVVDAKSTYSFHTHLHSMSPLILLNVKNFHGSLTTVVRAQNDTSKTANITDTIFDRTYCSSPYKRRRFENR